MSIELPLTDPTHPHWSTPIGWVGVGKARRPVFPIGGGAPEDVDHNAVNSDDDEDDRPATRAELELMRSRMRAADKRAGSAERALKNLQDEVESRKQQLADELADRGTKLADLNARIRAGAFRLAIFETGGYEWHDTEDVLGAIGSAGGVEFDPETGTVTGVKEALADLAKRKPHWVKSQGTTHYVKPGVEDEDDTDPEKPLTEAELHKRYPNLRGYVEDPRHMGKMPKRPVYEVKPWVEPSPVNLTAEERAKLMQRYQGLWKTPSPR
ncbi:hypothetical protein FF36_00026 [Frankia torreyi]|uniref:Uncharacterized protein n=1 Tax=Frankia torreyi TaxID=1856 RepID=A0A0D8BMH5_9ACTN|nr:MULTISPECIES: hypothetical protein [Frankia]KJE25413.1 hypothetical protein FF36_00026 [Frankia torreyi]